ncbi:MAG: tetratricopeptide repeat protein [Gammaproteobacteria bacterium]|nr:tetratricopeptide repeat protein [Gammaproteobacteria bacterium]
MGRSQNQGQDQAPAVLAQSWRAAVADFRAGRLERAEARLRALQRQFPELAELLELRGLVAHQQGQSALAVHLLERAAAAAPDDPRHLANLALVQEQRGCLEEAIATSERCTGLDPGRASAWFRLANLLRMDDRPGEAVAAYRRALQIDAADADCHANLGTVLLALDRPLEAVAECRRALELRPVDAQLQSNLGNALAAAGEENEAAVVYADCQRQHPGFVNAWINHAALCLREGDCEQAAALTQRALAVEPGNTSAMAYRLFALHGIGRGAEARQLQARDALLLSREPEKVHGFASLAEFNTALVDYARGHPTLRHERGSKTTRGGGQTRELLDTQAPVVAALRGLIEEAVAAYRERIADSGHPFARALPAHWQLHVWATVLGQGGHQAAHIHPAGWLSGVYYPELPQIDASSPAGWLEFGVSPEEFRLPEPYPTWREEPRVGRLLLFPSWYYHATVPAPGAGRVSIAFDVVPVQRPPARAKASVRTRLGGDAARALDRAITLHRDGDLDGAARAYADLEAVAGSDPGWLYFSALLADRRGELQTARQRLERAHRAQPLALPPFLEWLERQPANRPDEQLRACEARLARGGEHASVYSACAACFQAAGNAARARELASAALVLDPGNRPARHQRAIALHRLGQPVAAIADYQALLAGAGSGSAELHVNYALALEADGREEQAAAQLRQALALEPQLLPARFRLAWLRALGCDWEDWSTFLAGLERDIDGRTATPDAASLSPYIADALGLAPETQRRLGQLRAARATEAAPELPALPPTAGANENTPLRVGILSPDLCAHAVGGLVYGLFGALDRDVVSVHAYSLRRRDDALQQQIRGASDSFRDLDGWDDAAIAGAIREDRIQVLLDLGGYTHGGRPEVMAARPAPVQVSWLGYLNSQRADWIDYLLADAVVVPDADRSNYREAIVRLPGCFLPYSEIPMTGPAPARADCGLPQDAFVLASFNNTYKLDPELLNSWFSILEACPGAVLWLYCADKRAAQERIQARARAAGIDPGRLVFAPRVELSAHLARLPLADLCLDAFHYNGGASALLALRAGVPLLCLRGDRLLTRMGASLNASLGLDPMTARDRPEYVSRAIALARDAGAYQAVRAQLAAAIASSPLFSTTAFARSLEAALTAMWQAYRAGKPPAGMDITV